MQKKSYPNQICLWSGGQGGFPPLGCLSLHGNEGVALANTTEHTKEDLFRARDLFNSFGKVRCKIGKLPKIISRLLEPGHPWGAQ